MKKKRLDAKEFKVSSPGGTEWDAQDGQTLSERLKCTEWEKPGQKKNIRAV